MPIPLLIISSFLFFMSQTFTATSQQLPIDLLYPWKSKSGLIGYSNQNGQLKIPAQFEDASLFTNQFAIVEKKGKKGIIDKNGEIKLDCEYDEIQLTAVGEETLAITRKKHNAWWRINQWKLFPGFSFMGGTGDKRIFDTDVQRMKWEVILLSSKQTVISSNHQPNQYPYETSNIQRFDDKILINDQLYRIYKGHIKAINGVFKGFLTDSTLLRQDRNVLKIVDLDLKPKGTAVFKVPEQIIVKVNGHLQKLKTVSMISGTTVKFEFLEDQHQNIFLYPDLNKTFPAQVSQYFNNNTNADEIIRNAQIICSVPKTDYFLIYSIINNKKGFYILNKNGSWESNRSATKDFMIRYNSGNLMYPTADDLGINDYLPKDFELKRVKRTLANTQWFAVYGINKRNSNPLSGIFNTADKKWILPIAYSSLEEMKGYPYLWKFEYENETDYKKKKYGIIDINTRNITVEPHYNIMNADAKAGFFTTEKWDTFYVNPITGKEYREQ